MRENIQIPVTTEEVSAAWERLGYNNNPIDIEVILVRWAVASTLHAQGRGEFVESLGVLDLSKKYKLARDGGIEGGIDPVMEFAFRALGQALKYRELGSFYVREAFNGNDSDAIRKIKRLIMSDAGRAGLKCTRRPEAQQFEPVNLTKPFVIPSSTDLKPFDAGDQELLEAVLGKKVQVVLAYRGTLPFQLDQYHTAVWIVGEKKVVKFPRTLVPQGIL